MHYNFNNIASLFTVAYMCVCFKQRDHGCLFYYFDDDKLNCMAENAIIIAFSIGSVIAIDTAFGENAFIIK